jgi:hypothetical protein
MDSKGISWFIVNGTHTHTFIDDDGVGLHKTVLVCSANWSILN